MSEETNTPMRFQRQLVELLKALVHERQQWKSTRNLVGIVGAEIGVALGYTSRWLLYEMPDLTLWMVDAWRAYPEDHPYRISGDKRARLTLEQQIDRMEKAVRVTAFAIDRARVIRAESVDVAKWLREAGVVLDFVFIDAAHDYEDVAADLAAWYPLVRSCGLFSGHDYGHHKQPGVKRAVDEFFAANGLELSLGKDGAEALWYCWK